MKHRLTYSLYFVLFALSVFYFIITGIIGFVPWLLSGYKLYRHADQLCTYFLDKQYELEKKEN